MTWGYVAVAAATVVGSYMQSESQKDAANAAANAQSSMANQGVAEQRRQFDNITKLLSPYVNAGNSSLTQQMNLLGLNGNEAQQSAINGIKNSSNYGELVKQGENSILQNASATGGLRGGNTQAALAQFSPNLLNSLINQQYTNLGGITSLGQNSAALTGNAGMQSAGAISNLFNQAGAAQAGAAIASGKADSQFINNMTSLLGAYAVQGNNTSQTANSSSVGGSVGGFGGFGGSF